MPIRFRCAYCNQLMGIARRKAGSVVRCPKCAGEIIVPVPEGMDPQELEPPAGTNSEQPFDVEPAFPEPVGGPGTTVATTAPAVEPRPAPQPVSAPTPQRVGVFVPLGMLIISIGVVVLLLILMLVVGLLIGMKAAPDAKAAMLTVCNQIM